MSDQPENDVVTSDHTDLGSRILKVNHAGENGAIHIYAGRLVMARSGCTCDRTALPVLRRGHAG